MNTFLESAIKYVNKGWPVFPLRVQSKQPMIAGGFHKATTDIMKVREWWTKWPKANIGIPCGDQTFCVIDVDTHKGGEDSYQALKEEFSEFPQTLVQKTGSGGLHYCFRHHPKIGCTTSKLEKAIDTRGNNRGYIVVAPSIHENGNQYEWLDLNAELAEVPEWVIKRLSNGKKPDEKPVDVPFSAPVRRAPVPPGDGLLLRAEEYLKKCEPAIQGQGGHAKLLWACTAMVRGFLLDDETAFKLMSEVYNPMCSPPWDLGDPQELKEFRRKIREAHKGSEKPDGWLLDEYNMDLSSIEAAQIEHGREMAKSLLMGKTYKPETPEAPKILPEIAEILDKTPELAEILRPPGLVGEIAQFVNRTALKPQPLLTLGNTLAFCGALVGRKVRNEWDLRTNLYALGVAESCAGKDHSRKVIKQICVRAGVNNMILGGEDVTSDTAISACLEDRPSVLFMWDEIGHMLASMKDKFASPIRKSVVPFLMRLTGAANTVLLGKEYANENRVDIIQPNACIYGTTVPDVLYEGLSSAEIRDGLLGRLMVFRSTNDYPDWNDEGGRISEIPERLIERIQFWVGFKPEAPEGTPDIERNTGVFQVTVPTDKAAQDIFFSLRKKVMLEQKSAVLSTEPTYPLWGRAEEHARRVALILSALDCSHPSAAHITADHARYSCNLVMYLLTEFVEAVQFSIADSDQERYDKEVHAIIKKSAAAGIKHRDLTRATRKMSVRQRDDILKGLIQGEYVIRVPDGRTFRYYCPPYGLDALQKGKR